MPLNCPHCHQPLDLVASNGASNQTATPKTPQGVSPSLEQLEKLVKAYCSESRCTGLWSDQWAPVVEGHLSKFIATQAILDRSGVASWKESLLSQGLSPKTVNAYLNSLSAFSKWLINRGELQENPCTGQTVREGSKAAADQRLAFEPDEVRALLDYVYDLAPTPGHLGFIWTMAYTGARNEEIAQLRVSDVWRTPEEVAVFDLSTMEAGQRRKTAASRRLVPVHSKLMSGPLSKLIVPTSSPLEPSRNLWNFKRRGNKRGTVWGGTASRWANDSAIKVLKRSGKIRDDKRLTLYSLRHAVATQLKHKGFTEDLIAELVGHTNHSMTTGRYGKRYPVEKLQELVEAISW